MATSDMEILILAVIALVIFAGVVGWSAWMESRPAPRSPKRP